MTLALSGNLIHQNPSSKVLSKCAKNLKRNSAATAKGSSIYFLNNQILFLLSKIFNLFT